MASEVDAVEFREQVRGDGRAPVKAGPGDQKDGRMPRIITVIAFGALVLVAVPAAWLASGNGGAHPSQSPGATTVAFGQSEYPSLTEEPTDTLSYQPFVSVEESPGESSWDEATDATETASAAPSSASTAHGPACATEHYTVDPDDFGPEESYIVDPYDHRGDRVICGVVTGPSGERVRQVEMVFMTVGGPPCYACSTVTDAQGRYSIRVPAGKFHVEFGTWDLSKYVGGHLTPRGASYGDSDPSIAVVDTSRDDAVVNIQLKRMIKVRMTAVDQGGHPVRGIRCWTSTSSSYYAGTSDAEGRCLAPVLELTPFSVHVEDPLGRFESADYGGTHTLTAASPDVVVTLTLPFSTTATHAPTDPPVVVSPATAMPSPVDTP